MSKQDDTLHRIEKSMRGWIERQLPIYEEMDAGQKMTTTQGEVVWKANPAIQEIRANFRDYCYVVKTLAGLEGETEELHSTLDDMKKKFKIVR